MASTSTAVVSALLLGTRREGESRQFLDQALHQQTESISPHLTEITLLFKLRLEVPSERWQQCTGQLSTALRGRCGTKNSVPQDDFLAFGILLLFSIMANITHPS